MRMNSLLFVVEKKKVVLKLKKLTDGEKRMIKVIAADMDGTLLNPEHTLSDVTYRTILDAQKAGYRFLIATGRDYPSAVGALEKWNLKCDFITGSGAEIRDTEGSILQTIEMDRKWFRRWRREDPSAFVPEGSTISSEIRRLPSSRSWKNQGSFWETDRTRRSGIWNCFSRF